MVLQRKFIVGEEWFYYKIYAGIGIQERLLINEIHWLVTELYQRKIIDKFFFIRYSDWAGPHLRLRFHVNEPDHISIIIKMVCESLKGYVQSREIVNICIDTYTREIERYGARNIEDVESVFSINSWEILHFLKLKSSGPDYWLELISLIDRIFDHLEYNAEKRHQLCELSFAFYWDKFGNKEVKSKLKERYRENILKIEKALQSPESFTEYPIASETLKEIMCRIKGNCESSDQFEIVLRSIIHMYCNRFFSYKNNIFELVLYYMMSNYYRSSTKKMGAKDIRT